MKSLFYLSLLASGLVGAHAYGQSLYTLAGPVGLEESLPLKWTFNVAGGYDDNVNATNSNQQESAFISTDIGASLANYDAVTQYAFSAKLGGIFYLKDLEGDTNESLSNSTLNASLGGFSSLYVENVAAVFVLLFSVNFYLYYCILVGRWSAALKNEELRWLICIVAFSVVTIGFDLRDYYGSFAAGLRHAFFNVSMCVSTSSFNTVDYTVWPEYSKWVLLLLMLVGGCAGSTCGGLKLSRFMVLVKAAYCELYHMSRPRSIKPVMIEGKQVKPETLRAICTYFITYMFVMLFATMLISTDGFDLATNFSAALACLSNIGPGLGVNGPTGNYSMFSPHIKLLLSLVMLLGRLELYPVLVLFLPGTWTVSYTHLRAHET